LNKTELKVTSRRNPSEYAHILMSEKAQLRPIRTKSQKALRPFSPVLMLSKPRPDAARKTRRTQSRASQKTAGDEQFGKTQDILFHHSLKEKLALGCLPSIRQRGL
jgi:hypothetical protein